MEHVLSKDVFINLSKDQKNKSIFSHIFSKNIFEESCHNCSKKYQKHEENSVKYYEHPLTFDTILRYREKLYQ